MVTLDESVRTFSIKWLAEYVMEDEGLSSREDLNDLLMEAGFPLEANLFALTKLANDCIIQVTSSRDYSTDCALFLILIFRDRLPLFFDEIGEDGENNNYIRFRPASKLAVRSLTRKIYYKTSSIGGDKCTICLEEFKDGARVVTLPCGHEFHDKCIVDWFATSHFCPLCRFQFPCEDQ
ncbi:Zinc finger RING-type [Arabidopsis thaliana x Arabidopsis arenosa]|uniref:Zinc finger RING-type n=1 Tax=Arabidopsis thaliana x Arabidopsis arenosa TaxID=1240361 RepID=A0A8T2C2M8_9BRAS|nr:Zinc finger RING-type [Arabidopsis thaliana x Arabidopsis arenosa]